MNEAERSRALPLGPLVAELIAESGDTSGAIAAFPRVGDTEPVPVLAARSYERLRPSPNDHHDAMVWLDLAIGRAPAWRGFVGRARRGASRPGGVNDALADVEHVEAIAEGARAKYEVWRRAGEMWRAAGLASDSATLFERALRYAPDDPEALAGLGAALVDDASRATPGLVAGAGARSPSPLSARASQRATRGAALLARAVNLGEARGDDVSGMTINLARALADALGDRPAAESRAFAQFRNRRATRSPRARSKGDGERRSATSLEHRWRGRARAIWRARGSRETPAGQNEVDPATPSPPRDGSARRPTSSARSVMTTRPLSGTLRLRSACVRATPHRARRTVTFARVSPAPRSPSPLRAPSRPPRARTRAPLRRRRCSRPSPWPRPCYPRTKLVSLGASKNLTRMLQGDPTRDDVVDELIPLLQRLDRTMELFALLSGQLEDASPERRAKLLPTQRAVLTRLEEDARAAGRESEASLFRDARQALE